MPYYGFSIVKCSSMQQYITIFQILGVRGVRYIQDLQSITKPDLIHLRANLKRHIGQPDQLSYIEYFDAWTSGHEFILLSSPKGPFGAIETDWGSLHFAPSSRKLAYWLHRKATRKNIMYDETRLLYERLHYSLTEYDSVCSTGALLLFRQPIGSSIGDDEIEEYLESETLSD